MNLSDALDDGSAGGNNQSGGLWPSNPTNPSWPGQPAANPTWPGGQPSTNPTWPGGQPSTNPTWPGGQPSTNPTWPGGQPSTNPTWPGGQPSTNPTWPGGQPSTNPTWPGGQPSTNPTWPGGQPSTNPTWPGGSPSQPAGPGGWPTPSPGPGPGSVIPKQNLAVPYDHKLPNGVYDGLLITINGTIKPKADKITVNLSTANDLAFHFNPRFNESGRKVIVRNSCISKTWGREERELRNFPFIQGRAFEIKILCTKTEFKVAVNQSHLLEFKHRINSLKSINRVSIFGDLSLSSIHVET